MIFERVLNGEQLTDDDKKAIAKLGDRVKKKISTALERDMKKLGRMLDQELDRVFGGDDEESK